MKVTTIELRLEDKIMNAYYVNEEIETELLTIDFCLN